MNAKTSIVLVIAAILTLTGCAEPKVPPGMGGEAMNVPQLLEVYAQLTQKTVVAPVAARNDQPAFFSHPTPAMTRAEACKLVEKILREQAGLVVLHRDRHRIVFGFLGNQKPNYPQIEWTPYTTQKASIVRH